LVWFGITGFPDKTLPETGGTAGKRTPRDRGRGDRLPDGSTPGKTDAGERDRRRGRCRTHRGRKHKKEDTDNRPGELLLPGPFRRWDKEAAPERPGNFLFSRLSFYFGHNMVRIFVNALGRHNAPYPAQRVNLAFPANDAAGI
jgi:hypothetical protein